MNSDPTTNAVPPNPAHDETCPHCGYCRHCGRHGAAPVYVPPVYPQWVPPYYPYPWWGIYPPNGTVSVPSVWYDLTTSGAPATTVAADPNTANAFTITVNADPQGEGIRWNYTAGQLQ